MISTLRFADAISGLDDVADDHGAGVERRHVDRWPVQGVATAFCVSGEDFGRMHELRMLDYSDHGLGAVSDSVIECGTAVSIGFQSPGHAAKRGVVRRCRPCGDGYRISIAFDWRLAA